MTEVATMNGFDENANVSKSVKRNIFTESHVKRTTSRLDSSGNVVREVEEFSTSNDGEPGGSSVTRTERSGGYGALRSSGSSNELYATPEKQKAAERKDTPRPREDWYREVNRSRSVDPLEMAEGGKYGDYSRSKSTENILQDRARSATPSSYAYRSKLADRSTTLLDDEARKKAIEQLLDSTKKFARSRKSSEKTRLDGLVSDIMQSHDTSSDRYGSRYGRSDRSNRISSSERSVSPKSVERDYEATSPGSEKYGSSRYTRSDKFSYTDRPRTPRSGERDYSSRYLDSKYGSSREPSSRYQSSRAVTEPVRADTVLSQYRSPVDDIGTTNVDSKLRRSVYTRNYQSRNGEVLKDEENRYDDVFNSRPEMTTRVQRYTPANSAISPTSPSYDRRIGYDALRDGNVSNVRGTRRVDEVIRGDSNVRIRRSDIDTSVNITKEVPLERSITAEEKLRQERKASGMAALRNKIAALSKSVDELGQYKSKSLLRSYVTEHGSRPPVEVTKKEFPKVEHYEMKSKRVEPRDIDVDDIDYHKPDFAIPAGVRSPERAMSPPVRSPISPRITSPLSMTSPVSTPRQMASPVSSAGYHTVGELGLHIPKQISLKGPPKKKKDWWDVTTCEEADRSLRRRGPEWWNARTAEGVDTLLGIRPSEKYRGAVMATYEKGTKPEDYIFVRTNSVSSESGDGLPPRRTELESPHRLTRASSNLYLDEANDGKVELLIRVKSEQSEKPRYVAVRRGPVDNAVIVRTKTESELPSYASELARTSSRSEGVKLKDGFIKLPYKDMTPEFRKAWARIVGVEQKQIMEESGLVEIPVNIRHTNTEPVYALPNKSRKKTRMSAEIVQEPHVVYERPDKPAEIELVARVTPQTEQIPEPVQPRAPSLARSESSAFQEVKPEQHPQLEAKISLDKHVRLQKTPSKAGSHTSGESSVKSKHKEGSKKFWKKNKDKESKKHGHDHVDSNDMEVQQVLNKEVEAEIEKRKKKAAKKESSKKKKSEKKAQHQPYDGQEVQRMLLDNPYGPRGGGVLINRDVPNLYGGQPVVQTQTHHEVHQTKVVTNGTPLVKPRIAGIGTPVSGSFSGKQTSRGSILPQDAVQVNQIGTSMALPRQTSKGGSTVHSYHSSHSSDEVFFAQPQTVKYVTAERTMSQKTK